MQTIFRTLLLFKSKTSKNKYKNFQEFQQTPHHKVSDLLA